MVDADLTRANLDGADLTHAVVRGSDFSWADLQRTHFGHADLRGTQFRNANLAEADLTGSSCDHETIFEGAAVFDCEIDRYTLERLKDYGGLTVGNRMDMIIYDSVAYLRASFSGLRLWGHLIALAIWTVRMDGTARGHKGRCFYIFQ